MMGLNYNSSALSWQSKMLTFCDLGDVAPSFLKCQASYHKGEEESHFLVIIIVKNQEKNRKSEYCASS